MIQKTYWLILLICLSGCIPKEFIIPEGTDEEGTDGPQLTISVSPESAFAGEAVVVTVDSDKPLVCPPTVIITPHYEKKGMDITSSMGTVDQFTWQGTYTITHSYKGKSMVKVINALDEDGNRNYGTASFEVIMPEKEAVDEEVYPEEGETETTVEDEKIPWQDIRVEGVSINCLAGDGESLWFGTDKGIGRYNPLTNEWKGAPGTSNPISCLAVADDTVWFGSHGGGLFRYQKSTDEWLVFSKDSCDPNINDILIVDDLVLAATDHGLAMYDTLSEQWAAYTFQTTRLISEKITRIAWLYPYLWIGTDRGLMSYDASADVWQDRTTICNSNITCLFIDKDDLWIGTAGRGLIRYNTTDDSTNVCTTRNGLYNNSVLSLGADTTYVFVGHSGGISRLDRLNNTWSLFSQAMVGDTTRQINAVQAIYLDDDRHLWLGMDTGLLDTNRGGVTPPLLQVDTPGSTITTSSADVAEATSTQTLDIDTIPLSMPTVVADKITTGSWIIHGTATGAVTVELWGKDKLYGTTTPQDLGYFVFKKDPRRIPCSTTNIYVIGVDSAGNRMQSEPLVILSDTDRLSALEQTIVRAVDGDTITISGEFGQTTLRIPPHALAKDSQVTMTEIPITTGELALANFNLRREGNASPFQDSCLSLVCHHQADDRTMQAMRLCIPYIDDDCDGIVDKTNIRVETLKVFKLNQVSNRWEVMTDAYPVAARGEVWANIYEFGIYAVMPYEPAVNLSEVRAYPNPFQPDIDRQCTFSPLPPGGFTISIYNPAGELVRVLQHGDIIWDGNNDCGDPVASGIYFYLIKSAKGKATGRIGVIR